MKRVVGPWPVRPAPACMGCMTEGLDDRDLLWVQHELDSLVMARVAGGLGRRDAIRYRELCAVEIELIKRAS